MRGAVAGLLLAVLWLLAPTGALAVADACTCANETFSWGPTIGDNDAEWDTCADTEDVDTFTVGDGCVVTIEAGTTITSAYAGVGIIVTNGGQLNVEGILDTGETGGISVASGGLMVGERTHATNPAGLKVGTADLTVAEGGTFRTMGKIRTWGAAAPALAEEPSTTAYFQAGDVYPCPGDVATDYDCATDPQTLRLSYTVGAPGTAPNDWNEGGYSGPPPSGVTNFEGNFDATQAAAAGLVGDVVVFFDPKPDDAITYMNVNQPYEITGRSVGDVDPRWLEVDIRQGDVDDSVVDPDGSFYDLTNRVFRSALLEADAPIGTREFGFAVGTGMLDEDQDSTAKFLLLSDGATAPTLERSGYVIGNAKDDGGMGAGLCAGPADCDWFKLISPHGIATAHQTGDRVWTSTAGVRKGDPLYVMAPFRIVASSAAQTVPTSPQIYLLGTISLVNTVFDEPNDIEIGSPTTTATLERFQRVWIQDSLATLGQYVIEIRDQSNFTISDVWITSGQTQHGFTFQCVSDATVNDLSLRYMGDDNVLFNDNGGGACSSYRVQINRLRVEFMGGQDSSGSCVDATGGDVATFGPPGHVINDLYCGDAMTRVGDGGVPPAPEGAPDNVFTTRDNSNLEVNRIVVVGGQGALGNDKVDGLRITDLIRASGILESANYNPKGMQGADTLRNFVIRDMELQQTSGTPPEFYVSGPNRVFDFQNGWIDNVRVWQPNHTFFKLSSFAGAGSTLRNLAFTDIWKDAAGECGSGCLVIWDNAENKAATLENIGIGYRPTIPANLRYTTGFAGMTAGVFVPEHHIGGILVSSFTDTATTFSAMRMSWLGGNGYARTTYTGPLCFWNNYEDMSDDMRNDGPACDPGDRCGWIEQYAEVIEDDSFEPPSPDSIFPILASGVHAQDACGPKVGLGAPGVTKQIWAASIAGLGPEFLAGPLACGDALDNDGDGLVDLDDAGCADLSDLDEHAPTLPCDDGADNDGDGKSDFLADGSGDPGCASGVWGLRENPQCQDGLDNDGQPGIDFDGGASLDRDHDGFIDWLFNPATPAVGAADPQCIGTPWKNKEASGGCGFGFEIVFLAPLLARLARRRRAVAALG